MKLLFVAAAVLLSALAMLGPAAALTVNYAEDISGDLLGGLFPTTRFAFDIGTNMVTGTICGGRPGGVLCNDSDSFGFTIATGGSLTEVVYSFGLRADPGLTTATTFFDFDLGIRDLTDQTVDLLGTSPVPMFGDTLPLGHEPFVPYVVYNTQVLSFPNATTGWIANYTWRFTVGDGSGSPGDPDPEPVPEPASLLLLTAGALGLIGALHRRRRRPDSTAD